MQKIMFTTALMLVVIFSAILIAEEHKAQKPLEEVGYSWIDLKKDVLGRFIVKAEIDGNEYKLIINETMDRTIIDVNTLEKYSVDYDETGQEYNINGDDDDLYVFTAKNINIGEGVLGEQDLFAVDFEEFDYFEDTRADGFLGSDFLLKYQAMIDLANQRIYLYTK